ncbi:outer spore coat protein CotE [Paenibacillus thermoaerophilus]|uniref:Outer spore coat protein CotE n=1 Tax=Paenibacillus thermoaerophilus TaxID=1215385 RepID=A0ABW2V3W6_9BACL|nr:outer spore coat protein CotE [Paenibacillus thermoaerophilus]TMV17109.1 outer spore coat protein CotE [Paenibacillus thermoaerophilus]
MAHTEKQTQTREIYVKAVCGKGRKFAQVTHTVTPPHAPSSILGCWVINHQYEAVKSGNGVEVVGTYDINIWYSYDKNTKTDVAKETVPYSEPVPLTFLDPNVRAGTEEVHAYATQEPNCVEANVAKHDGSVVIRVEREFRVELVAETKIYALVSPVGPDDFDDKDVDFVHTTSDDDFEDLDPDFLDDDLS